MVAVPSMTLAAFDVVKVNKSAKSTAPAELSKVLVDDVETPTPLTVMTSVTSTSSMLMVPVAFNTASASSNIGVTLFAAVTVGPSFVPLIVTSIVRVTTPPSLSRMSKVNWSVRVSPAAKNSTAEAKTE